MHLLSKVTTQVLMTILVNTSTFPARVDVPRLPWWAVPRQRLADRLEAGEAGLAAVVTAPPGAGKTTAVGSWSKSSTIGGRRSGRNAAHAGPDAEAVLREDQIAAALMHQPPSVIVVDDLSAEPSPSLSQDLEMLLSQANHQLSVVLIGSGLAALPLYLDLGSVDLMRIGFEDLVMDEHEVQLVLDQHGVSATEATIRAVVEHTAGWACGVRLATLSLQKSGSVEAALHETDEQINRFFDRKIISKLAPAARDLIVEPVSRRKCLPISRTRWPRTTARSYSTRLRATTDSSTCVRTVHSAAIRSSDEPHLLDSRAALHPRFKTPIARRRSGPPKPRTVASRAADARGCRQ